MRWGIVLGVLAGLFRVGDAWAGTYTVHACSLPNGVPAPIEGWSYSWNNAPGAGWNVTCANGQVSERAISAWTEGAPLDTYSRFTFTAPRDTLITGYTLYRYERARASGGATGLVEYADGHGVLLDGCGAISGPCVHGSQDPALRLSAGNRTQRDSLRAERLTVTALCTAYAGAVTRCDSESGAWVSIYAAQMQLQDALTPVLTEQPSGPPSDSAVVNTQTMKVAAQDKGGGLASASLLVDGHIVATAGPDASTGGCVVPYVRPVPCPLESSFHLDLDSRQVANGSHELQVEVVDAAGNATRSESRTITVLNDGAPNGSRPSRLAVLSGHLAKASRATPLRRLVNYGQRVALNGRLTDASGAPIAGARLSVEAQVDRGGEPWRAVGEVVTADDGGWAADVGSGASRRIRVSYRAFAADPAPSAELVASIRVRARVSLSVTPRRTGPAGRIVFRGRLVGGPGRARTQVTLYAVPGRGRRSIPVRVLSAGSDGRFRYAYRFSGAYSDVTYSFQARVASQPGYPYAAGASRKVAVKVRG